VIALRVLLTVGILLFPASGWAQRTKVKVEHDSNVDFTAFKTYAWKRGTPAATPAANQFLVDSIEEKLAARGLQKQTGSQADLYVVYHVVPGNAKFTVDSFDYGWPSWDRGKPAGSARYFLERTLVLDMLDTRTEEVVWRGTGTGVLESDTQEMTEKTEKALEKMFKKFPPRKS
jgi:hypothetical protein